MDKQAIIDILEEIHTLLELQGENRFRSMAYHNGARALEKFDGDFGELIESGKLIDLPGIGESLAEKITELYKKGRLKFYDDLKKSINPSLTELLQIPGIGPKKIKLLHDELGIDSIEKLEKACLENRVEKLPGFGPLSEKKILEGIGHQIEYSKRYLWWQANEVADRILKGLKKLPSVKKAEFAGSFRRKMETVGDLDLVAGSDNEAEVTNWFTHMPDVMEIVGTGPSKATVHLKGGMHVDLRILPVDQYYFALHHFTGSKEHNIVMRNHALKMGYSLSEWGMKPAHGSKKKGETQIKSEEALFKKFGLHYIPPELREGGEEFQYAQKKELPKLIEEKDIKGVFHNHTTNSDGINTLKEMVQGAQNMGWEYFGVADHSKSSFQANGLSEEMLMEQIQEIERINKSKEFKIYIFAGSEVDILKNGKLDYEDALLKKLEYVVVSVHSSFSLTEEEQTKRIIKAIENPYVTMLGHLTGRLLLKREGYKVNISKVIDAAIANNVVIELNASPNRLDMDWRYWHKASDKGLKCSINPDAHSVAGLEYYRAGVNIARKGWLTKEHVINTWTLKKVREFFAKKR